MKKWIALAIAGVAMVGLSGCNVDGNECNTRLQYLGATDGVPSGKASSIRLDNKSDYVIEEVYTGINGTTRASSDYIPTAPGEFFVIDSSYCNEEQILKIIDDEGCSQEMSFFRACDETANFQVVNNY